MARFDMRCTWCGHIQEVEGPMGKVPHVYCPYERYKGHRMEVYHGRRRDIPINFGFRESRYQTKEDSDIARYQFEHL